LSTSLTFFYFEVWRYRRYYFTTESVVSVAEVIYVKNMSMKVARVKRRDKIILAIIDFMVRVMTE
jgi:hypothetical protein